MATDAKSDHEEPDLPSLAESMSAIDQARIRQASSMIAQASIDGELLIGGAKFKGALTQDDV